MKGDRYRAKANERMLSSAAEDTLNEAYLSVVFQQLSAE